MANTKIFLVKSENPTLVKGVTLSVTTTFGMPCVASKVLKCSIVM